MILRHHTSHSSPDSADLPVTVGASIYPAQAIIQALEPHVTDARVRRIDEVLDQRIESIVLGIENLHHSHNAAACLRTAEAFGLQDVVAVEDLEPLPLEDGDPSAQEPLVPHKISKTAHRWLDLHSVDGPEAVGRWGRSRGYRIFGALPSRGVTVSALPTDKPALLLFGNELEGLRPETIDVCDDAFRIPMFGFTESFNISVSVGIVLHDIVPRRRQALAGLGIAGDLPPARKIELKARWYLRDVRAARLIVRRKLGDGLARQPESGGTGR